MLLCWFFCWLLCCCHDVVIVALAAMLPQSPLPPLLQQRSCIANAISLNAAILVAVAIPMTATITTSITIAFAAAIATVLALAAAIFTFVIAAVTNTTATALHCPSPSIIVCCLLPHCTSLHCSHQRLVVVFCQSSLTCFVALSLAASSPTILVAHPKHPPVYVATIQKE
jgi:hypothetical protein